jgi:hypothetical protein
MRSSHVLIGAMLMFLMACAMTGSPEQWIRVGVTTRAEVVEQYGEPDMVTVSNDEETAIYRAKAPGQASMRIDIPTAQMGPFGAMTTKTQSVDPGLGARALNAGAVDRPGRDFHIRYDSRGLVLEVQ